LLKALRVNDDYLEAEALGYETLKTPAAHEMTQGELAWFRGQLALVLVEQGKVEEAKTVFQALPPLEQRGNVEVVSQLLKCSEALAHYAYYREALEFAGRAKGCTSLYDDLAMKSIQACANAKLGRRADANAIVNLMMASPEATQREVTIRALLCVDRDTEASHVMVTLLSKYPEDLTEFQGCGETKAPLTRELNLKILKIFDRPEVQKVVQPIGRTRQACSG
jgi:hypothetical protein